MFVVLTFRSTTNVAINRKLVRETFIQIRQKFSDTVCIAILLPTVGSTYLHTNSYFYINAVSVSLTTRFFKENTLHNICADDQLYLDTPIFLTLQLVSKRGATKMIYHTVFAVALKRLFRLNSKEYLRFL